MNNAKDLPKWYLLTSLIIVILLLIINTIDFVGYSLFPIIVIGSIGFFIFNFILFIYFFAKKYSNLYSILPILLILYSIFSGPWFFNIFVVYFFGLIALSYMLYLLWKE